MTSLNHQALNQFRREVYQILHPSRDAAFEIMDAITQSPGARSAVEVSLAAGMQRKFSSVHKGLERTRVDTSAVRSLLVRTAATQEHFLVAGYAVWALDHTPYPRPNAPSVADVKGTSGSGNFQPPRKPTNWSTMISGPGVVSANPRPSSICGALTQP